MRRRSLEETWQRLSEDGFDMPRRVDGSPYVPPRKPRFDDETLGFSFFKEGLSDEDLNGLELPRTFFGRSCIERISLRFTNLCQSNLCWNDFVDCDFSAADLTDSDLRASLFERCRFDGAVLVRADLRLSTFVECRFVDADLTDARLTLSQKNRLPLTPAQQNSVVWKLRAGAHPSGG